MSNKTLLLLFIVILSACNKNTQKNYIQFVDQEIGTNVSTTKNADGSDQTNPVPGQTIIGVSAPFGMTSWTPQLQSGQRKCEAPYYLGNIFTEGFRATHWISGSCEKDYGSFSILPTTLSQEYKFLPNRRSTLCLINYDDNSPAYLSVGFVNEKLLAELTGTERCGFFRFSWLLPIDPVIMVSVNNEYNHGFIQIDLENQEIIGYNPVEQFYRNRGESAGIAGYFVAKFNQKFQEYGTYGNFDEEKGSTQRENQRELGAYVSFKPENDEPILMKVGTSFTSIENARKNLDAEISDWDFYGTRNRLAQQWNEILGTIEIETTDSIAKTEFYTALYHSLLHPRLMSDSNGDYPVFGQMDSIRNTTDFKFYGDFMSWNTSRAQMPLLSLIAPEQYNDMVKSLLVMAEDGGWLPDSPTMNSYNMSGTGDYASSIVVDAAMKGFDFDYGLAFDYLKKNAMEVAGESELNEGKGRPGLDTYIQNGFIPLEEQLLDFPKTESQVARTMEYAYNDWCVAQLADKLGQKEDFDILSMRALSFTNVYDENQGWVNGRHEDGSFFSEFDPDLPQSFFNDQTARQYTWYVPHDVPTLIDLMGGEDRFSEELSSFLHSAEYRHDNAGTQHIPYLYNNLGDWESTQKNVKEILKREYGVSIGGLAGHENAGQLSAWYVFSSLGFYPACPGNNEYQLSSPIFEKATLHLDKKYYPGGNLVLSADSDAASAIFNSVTLNGNKTGTAIGHELIQKGGELHFSK